MFELTTWPRSPWSIFDEMESLQDDMNRLFAGEASGGPARRGRAWRRRPTYPLMNVWSSADGVVIDAELPGVDPKDVDISVTGDELTLRGKVNVEKEAEAEPAIGGSDRRGSSCGRCSCPSGRTPAR